MRKHGAKYDGIHLPVPPQCCQKQLCSIATNRCLRRQSLPGRCARGGRCGCRRRDLIDQRCATAPFQYVRGIHIHYLTVTIQSLTYYVVIGIEITETISTTVYVTLQLNSLTGYRNNHATITSENINFNALNEWTLQDKNKIR